MTSTWVELVRTTTADGLRLDGIYQTPSTTRSDVDANDSRPAILCVHGTGGNFYSSTLFDLLGASLLNAGHDVLRINTRGHDSVSIAASSEGGVRQGAAFERWADARLDLSAWLTWLRDRGKRRVIALGHSSGAVKAILAASRRSNGSTSDSAAAAPSTREMPTIATEASRHERERGFSALIALSPPRLSHSWFMRGPRADRFREYLEQARRRCADGDPHALMDVTFPLPMLISAAGYLEKYGPEERYNYLNKLGDVPCSMLITFGSKEVADNPAFTGMPDAARAAAPHVDAHVIDNADHFYRGVESRLTELVLSWLNDRSNSPHDVS